MKEVYGEEIRRAKRAWEARHDAELSWAEIARRCEAILKRRVFPEQIIRFKDQKQEPRLAEFRAMAEVLETYPGALAFGSEHAHRVEIPQEPEQPVPVELQKPTKRRRQNG